MTVAGNTQARPILSGRAGAWLRAVMVAVFVVVTLRLALPPVIVGLPFGWDAPVYTEAARAWLEGGNPWAVQPGLTFPFAGPPPSFLPYLPFVLLPAWATSVAWIAIAAGSAVYVLRRLGLPMWWLLFPPVSLGIMAGSTALPVTALLVRGGVIAEALAVVTRVYAALPLLILGRWRSLALAAGLLAVTLPMWPQWIAERETWSGAFVVVEGMSASGWLILPAIVGLVLMGRERSAWLVVPALWPDAQLYYAVIALPVLRTMPLVALSLALPVPGLVVAGLVGQWALDYPKMTAWVRPSAAASKNDAPTTPRADVVPVEPTVYDPDVPVTIR